METQVIKIDPQTGHSAALRRASDVLVQGGLVSFPTETVYGLGVRADDPEAVARLRRLKSREGGQAFTVHIASSGDAVRFAPETGGLANRLIRKGWPGPLTLILAVECPASAPVMTDLNGSAMTAIFHENSVGLRCPDDPFAQALLREATVPVVAASANRAGQPPPFSASAVLEELDGELDLVVDGGTTRYAKPSTIVRVTGSTYKVVREGVYDSGIIERLSALRLLLVCTGNTCRSPMAAMLAMKMIAERLDCSVSDLATRGVFVDSAGTAGGFGGASVHAVNVMAHRGLDLTEHVSAALSPEIVQQADHILAMTRSHRDMIVDMVPPARDRVALLLDDRDVEDPIGGSGDDYERCARTIEEGLRARLQEVMT